MAPLLMLAVYLLAFGPLVRGHWPGVDGWGEFALVVFAGLAVHGLFAECLARAPMLVAAQPGYVTRVLFPLVETDMVLLHGFIKKSDKTPKDELELAKQRRNEVHA